MRWLDPRASTSRPPVFNSHKLSSRRTGRTKGLRCSNLKAVDQDGYVLDEVVQTRRDTRAAKCLLKRLLRKQGCPPRRLITDKLGSYAAAQRQIMPEVEHRSHKGLNNRAENSHLPFRRRERVMQGFRSPRYLQRFVSVFSAVRNLFVPPRSRRSPLPPICTASTLWRNGSLQPTLLLEPLRQSNRPTCACRKLT